jgi:hypothetical protein
MLAIELYTNNLNLHKIGLPLLTVSVPIQLIKQAVLFLYQLP